MALSLRADCWAADWCKPETFKYKLCKLRLRNRKTKDAYGCPEGQVCEELDCGHKCWLPKSCTCHPEGHEHQGRMTCLDDEVDGKPSHDCFAHPSTQWGLCVDEPPDDHPDDEPIETHFHFWTPDELLQNAKLHINEDSPMKGASRGTPPAAALLAPHSIELRLPVFACAGKVEVPDGWKEEL